MPYPDGLIHRHQGVFCSQGVGKLLFKGLHRIEHLLDIGPDKALGEGATQWVDGKDASKGGGKAPILGCGMEFELGALQLPLLEETWA